MYHPHQRKSKNREAPVPVHYCLGLTDSRFAECADPWDFGPLADELRNTGVGEVLGPLARLPSFAWTKPRQLKSHLIAHLRFPDHGTARNFHESLKNSRLQQYGFGQDPIISAMDSWSPTAPGGGIFGDRAVAERLTGATALRAATGKGVNVIIVDRGLDQNRVTDTAARMARNRGLPDYHREREVRGWPRYEATTDRAGKRISRTILPGATGSDHGYMIARNILAIAPEATIWDAPLLPLENEQDAPPNPSTASHLFQLIKQAFEKREITSWDADPKSDAREPCIIVNAWGVLDPESDPDLAGYADDPDHLLINDMERLDKAGIDVVFAAGNCGEPCPDRRCGLQDTGPGRSILGWNAHPRVLTVGAVRVDGLPVALSAQGPGRLARKGSGSTDYTDNLRARQKPDLSAPSHFRESDDASEFNTGTSAACGFAAGVLAALRSVPSGRGLCPEAMRSLLRDNARPAGAGWDPRLGFGTINLANALAALGK
jgi:subtilisin family serine protease